MGIYAGNIFVTTVMVSRYVVLRDICRSAGFGDTISQARRFVAIV